MRPNFVWQVLLVLSFAASGNAWGWGGTAHKFINQNAVVHLPSSLAQLAAQQEFLANHASDADNRKSADTAEAPKHYIDLESYPDFPHLPANLASLIAQYGWATVKEIGILPWATAWSLDSLTAQLERGEMSKAYQTAADLGHYVADAHQPLHCTVNYNGQFTGNDGIHSRYESGMINLYQSLLTVSPDSARYVADPYAFALDYILRSLTFADSIMQADNAAKAASGWNGFGTPPQSYYTVLWQQTQHMTTMLIQEATVHLACLWYTAWVNAGLVVTLAANEPPVIPSAWVLFQNYPNPFNPSTVISFELPAVSQVDLRVFDVLGREVAVLADERRSAGIHSVHFDGSGLASGVYLYRLEACPMDDGRAGGLVQTKKLQLIR